MPELPEVETIRRELAQELRGKKISKIEIRLAKMIRGSVLIFQKKAVGAAVLEVQRRAKLLIIILSNGYCLLIHLKMTGQLVYRDQGKIKVGGHPIKNGIKDLPNKYTYVIFYFIGRATLFFNDLRQFGFIQLVLQQELEDFFKKNNYGPEPLDHSFTLETFKQLLKKRKITKIKPLLMDQTFIAGVGNIYATEACFYAGIRPVRPAARLTQAEAKRLFNSLRSILQKAIAKRGTSVDNYIDAYGRPGDYVPLLKMYGRAGNKCLRCGTIIKALTLAGRGTTYCPKCQR